MLKIDQKEELTKRLELSERKRIQLQKKMSQEAVDDDLPLWSMVDLMTLLLIFFILMYSLNTKEVLSSLTDSTRDIPNVEVITPPSFPPAQDIETPPSSPPAQNMESLVETPPSFPPAQDMESLDEPYPAQEPHAAVSNKSDNLDTTLEQLKQDVLSALGKNGKGVFSVRSDQHRFVLVVGERITFRVGEAKLLTAYYPIFKRISNFISSKPNYRVVVSGHTDNTPISTPKFPSNLELSAARAINVAKFLTESGVSPQRISVQGFSQYRPLFENTTRENQQANRRVEIELIKEQDRVSEFY